MPPYTTFDHNSLVDHTHSTATQLLGDFVVGDGLVDHELVGRHQAFEFFEPVEDECRCVSHLKAPLPYCATRRDAT